MRLPRRANLITAGLFLLSGAILAWSLYSTFTIDVIDDKTWRLVLPAGEIHAGTTIYVKSEYTKLRQVEGQAERYIECKTKDGVQVSYHIETGAARVYWDSTSLLCGAELQTTSDDIDSLINVWQTGSF